MITLLMYSNTAHSSGYLEILNKSDYVCAVKLWAWTGGEESLPSFMREACRPCYVSGE